MNYFKAEPLFTAQIVEKVENQEKVRNVIAEWLKQVIGPDVETHYTFSDVPIFTEENLRKKPELRQLCTKSSARRLSTRNPEAKAMINDWKTYRDNHEDGLLVKRWNPFNDDVLYTIRKAFPTGAVNTEHADDMTLFLFESDCQNVNKELVTEIDRKEYLELLLEMENNR